MSLRFGDWGGESGEARTLPDNGLRNGGRAHLFAIIPSQAPTLVVAAQRQPRFGFLCGSDGQSKTNSNSGLNNLRLRFSASC
jgi:hypothetical protein